MPGLANDSSRVPVDETPYVPAHCYKNGPKMCPCGDHEGFHADNGVCLRRRKCGCLGLPARCLTPLEEM